MKFGIGRATYDVAQELRNDHLTIEEGKKLIKKYDGEFPDNYFSDTMKYLGINENFFIKLCERFRSPHLWKKINNKLVAMKKLYHKSKKLYSWQLLLRFQANSSSYLLNLGRWQLKKLFDFYVRLCIFQKHQSIKHDIKEVLFLILVYSQL